MKAFAFRPKKLSSLRSRARVFGETDPFSLGRAIAGSLRQPHKAFVTAGH
jgi:hypothetical protein